MRAALLVVGLAAMFFQAHAQQPVRGIRECPPTGCTPYRSPSSSATAPNGRSASSSAGQAARVLEAVGTYLGQSAREAAQRESDASTATGYFPSASPNGTTSEQLQWQRDEAIKKQAVEETLRRLADDPSLNPFGQSAPAVADSNNGSKESPLPQGDLTGSPCRWMVVKDAESCGSRSCFYSEGQTVAVGSSAYVCRSGTWAKIRDCTQSPTAQHAKECNRDIIAQHGAPGTKESASAKVFAPD